MLVGDPAAKRQLPFGSHGYVIRHTSYIIDTSYVIDTSHSIVGQFVLQETYLSRHMAKHQQGDGAGIGASISDFGTKTLPRHPIKQESMDGLSSEHGDPVVPFPPSAINQHCSHDRSPIDLGSPSAGRIVVDSSVRPPMRGECHQVP